MEEPEHGANESAKRSVKRAFLQDLEMVKTLSELRQQLEGFTFEILDFQIEESPMRLQCHTIGVPNHWMRLLYMIARSIECYHEHH